MRRQVKPDSHNKPGFKYCKHWQVALIDILTQLNIRPDGILGHSTGEIACGYADGCMTQEETLLSAYWRGRSVVDGKLPEGAMAAVGKWFSLFAC